uniref:Heat shock protein 70-like protein n=1 Tax=Ginger chlorotic fleck-associated virus TaxID=2739639 RepID=A0A6M8F0W3_9CLOS|nr:heat shock protein 70-like protein [Ginger chlorotic fleck-associated virus]
MEVGIDFGTTYSTLSFSPARGTDGCVVERDTIYIPTVVGYRADGTYAIGRGALLEPGLVIYRDIKRYFGMNKYNERQFREKLKPQIEIVVGEWSCGIGPVGGARNQTRSVIGLAAHFVSALVQLAVKTTGQQVTVSVCSVPAEYNTYFRSFIFEACRMADISVQAVVNEPTAAGLSTFIKIPKGSIKYLLVYDFGGGTFDSSLMVVGNSYVCVLDSAGDNHLGGRDVDNALLDWLEQNASLDVSNFSQFAMEALKIDMVDNPLKTLRKIISKTGTVSEFVFTYADFARLCAPFVERAKTVVKELLRRNSVRECTAVLIGGSSVLPGVSNSVASLSGVRRVIFERTTYRAAVALGAALYAQTFSGVNRYRLIDSVSSTLADERLPLKAVAVFPKGHPIPAVVEVDYTMPNYDTGVVLHEGENPFINNLPRTYSADVKLTDFRARESYKQKFSVSEDGRLEVSMGDRMLENLVKPKVPPRSDFPEIFVSSDDRRIGPEVAEIKAFYAKFLNKPNLPQLEKVERSLIYKANGLAG